MASEGTPVDAEVIVTPAHLEGLAKKRGAVDAQARHGIGASPRFRVKLDRLDASERHEPRRGDGTEDPRGVGGEGRAQFTGHEMEA